MSDDLNVTTVYVVLASQGLTRLRRHRPMWFTHELGWGWLWDGLFDQGFRWRINRVTIKLRIGKVLGGTASIVENREPKLPVVRTDTRPTSDDLLELCHRANCANDG